MKRYDNVLALVIGTCWIDIDGDKQHFVGGTETKKFGSASSLIIFYDENDDVND